MYIDDIKVGAMCWVNGKYGFGISNLFPLLRVDIIFGIFNTIYWECCM